MNSQHMSSDNNEYMKALNLVKKIWAKTKCIKVSRTEKLKGQTI